MARTFSFSDDESDYDAVQSDGSEGYMPPSKLKAKTTVKKPAADAPGKSKAKVQTTLTSKLTASSKKRPSDHGDSLVGNGSDVNELSNTPPHSKKQKKAETKKSAGAPLSEIENDSIISEDMPAPNHLPAGQGKTHSENYQRLSLKQHILVRPDSYIGSVEFTKQPMWVFNKETSLMERREINFVPGLYKIFDEILVNAADNKQRDSDQYAPMSYIKVTIDREKGVISVENNGKGIPVVIHEKEKLYIPEMIFGYLLTGSNYNDEEKKTVGGRNGYGAKLCNVFSTEFQLEVQDSINCKRYKQTWTDNMSKAKKPSITSNKTADFVRITFKPDFDKFKMPNGIDDDLESLVYRRIYDLAGTIRGVKVFLNGSQIKVKDFKGYCELYAKAIAQERMQEDGVESNATVIMDSSKTNSNRRWEVGFTVSDGTFQQVSFVNNIATTVGGTHVNYITDQITAYLLAHLNKTRKGHALKQNHIRNHLFIFIHCLIDNPAFNSQTKEQLTTKASQFGSKYPLPEEFLKKIAKSDAINKLLAAAEQKADKLMSKSDGNRRSRINNAKLVDANLAGTKRGHECTLILTEGDSAKSLAVAGRAILDPDRIGVFPLRGKLLNVRDASIDAITKNQEIQNIKQFLGLKHKQTYTDTKSLRYGHLMIMADQDHDGSHIKGLLINFLQVQFPSLLQIPDFFQEFITPIVKVWQGTNDKKPKNMRLFFTMPEYEEWKEEHKHEMRKWRSKYIKGLGTNSNEDAQVYFTNLDQHLKEFETMKSNEADLFELAFSKKKADARKEWLGNFVPGTFLNMSTKSVSYSDFVNKELILFSMADNIRSIPSVIDGLKPGQRKVIFACFKKNLVKDMKVIELSGYVSGETAYKHGDASLQQTIIGLAQDYIGSNNVNCLVPSGNFGSRLSGGSDAASARYIYTRLSPFARKVFSALDEPVLNYEMEDGKRIEPTVYVPVVPLVLVNGADGIGTGWSTNIPNYHPMDIINNLRRRMGRSDDCVDGQEQPFQHMDPWFRGWKGVVEHTGPDRYKFNGIAVRASETSNEVIITELPIRLWTDDFKARLEEIISSERSWIKDYKEFNDHRTVRFEVMLEDRAAAGVFQAGLLEQFKLTKQISTSNLVAFDTHGQIHKYQNVQEILEEFYQYRFQVYSDRRTYWLGVYHRDYRKLTNQARFIQEIIDNKIVVGKKRKTVLVAELRQRRYEAFPRVDPNAKGGNEEEEEVDDETAEADAQEGATDYDYLLSMPIWSLTSERLAKLLEQIAKKKSEYDDLEALTEKDLWCRDLDDFEAEWEEQLRADSEMRTKINRLGRRASVKIGVGKGRKATKKVKGEEDDSDFELPKARPKGKAASSSGISSTVATVPKEKAAERFASIFNKTSSSSSKSVAPKTEALGDDDDDDYQALAPTKPVKTAKAPVARKASGTKVKTENSLDLEEDDDGDEEPMPARSQAPRRAAAAKIKSWALDDFDSSEDDTGARGGDGETLMDDVSSLVKGIGSSKTTAGSSATSASTAADSSRLSRISLGANTSLGPSTSGLGRLKTRKSDRSLGFLEDDHGEEEDEIDFDDTNYDMLAKSSPHKTAKAAFTNRKKTFGLSDDDDDDDDDIVLTKPAASKRMAAAKPKATTASSSLLPSRSRSSGVGDDEVDEKDSLATKAKAPVKKAVAKTKPTTAAAKPKGKGMTPSSSAGSVVTLSPAAKAYASKKKKKTVLSISDDEEEEEEEEGEETLEPPTPVASRSRRPARAAAAAPKKPVFDFDSEEEEEDEEEEDFDLSESD